jgi:hypothetical protein
MSGEKMSKEKNVFAETKLTEETKLFEEKKVVDPYVAGFVESMAKTNTEKITEEILEGLSEDTGDSDSYDVESGDEDSEDRPWRPSHSVFGKSTIKQSHLENMRGRYFWDMSIVRVGGDNNVPACRCFGSDRTPGVAPQGVFRSRTVSPTVAKWFVPDARGTIDNVYRFGPLGDA